jgi:Protein of unknown function (DUF3078)
MKFFTLTLLFVLAISTLSTAQDAAAPVYGWSRVGAMGFDLSGLGVKNPRVGAGLNRFGIGGLGSYAANRKEEKWYWDNTANLQLGVVRLGGAGNDFTKSTDVIRLQSKLGHPITKDGKWNLTGLVIGTSQLLKSYTGNLLKGTEANLFSKFLAPAQLQFHPGIEWKPNSKFSLLISPVGLNSIIVSDKNLANKNIHGNELGKTHRTQIVPALQASYQNKFLKDRVTYTSALNLTTDYTNKPFVLTALNFWQNNLSFAIGKGLSLDLFGEAAYDHYKFVQKDVDNDGKIDLGTLKVITNDGDIPASEDGKKDRLGRGVQMIGSFMLKYNKAF